jgi:16S rRNA (cytosine967-C5)-methyltransferase
MAAVSPARKAAFQILMALEHGQAHSDDLLRGKGVSALSAADRNLTTALVLGVLRWQIRLDHQIQGFLKRPNARLDTEVRIALRIGAFQLLHMDRIPARAAIGQSVEIAKQAGHHFASRMANAVLRKIAADLPSFQASEGTAAELALAQGHPRWMVERWVDFYGFEAARAICHHGQSQPMLSVRIAHQAAEEELAAGGIVLEPGQLLAPARRVRAGDVTATSAFQEDRVRLQDEGSQIVAELAGRADMILDCCAAPGGKTLILAERNPNAHIVACEASPQRLAQLSDRLAPLGSRHECRLADATELTDENVYDLALADVPCSGTGTLGRNPEIRHRLRPEDLRRQAERQMSILRAALRAVRPGGYVVYSTCSLEPEENENVVATVLAGMSGARIAPMDAGLKALLDEGILKPSGADRLRGCVTSEGFLRLLPGAFHTDGFFIAILGKVAT